MRIIIDPGHGGKDPGAIGINGRREKDITLTICHYMAGILLHGGHEPILTRYRDIDVSLSNRGSFARNNNGELFVSVHCNSFNNSSANGFEIYYHPAADLDSISLSRSIHDVVIANTNLRSRGIKASNFQVLRDTYKFMPAVLIETGFISNPGNFELINSLVGQWRLANYISKGIMDFIGS